MCEEWKIYAGTRIACGDSPASEDVWANAFTFGYAAPAASC